MREAGARLLPATGSAATSFTRGAPEGLRVIRKSAWQADLYDLISAYGSIRARSEPAVHLVARRAVMTLEDALVRIERLLARRWNGRKSAHSFLRRGPGLPQIGFGVELRRDAGARAAGEGGAGPGRPFAPLYVRAA
jgi:segregation and condensation protein A